MAMLPGKLLSTQNFLAATILMFRCIPEKEEHKTIEGMVHGKCECDHNTMGNNCELCMDFYHDVPWSPATGKLKNECKRCNCNEHTDKCHFDSRVFAVSC